MGAENGIHAFDGWLMDDAKAVEKDDDGEGEEDDSDADAGSCATLLGGGGKATVLLRIRGLIVARPRAFRRFGHSVLR